MWLLENFKFHLWLTAYFCCTALTGITQHITLSLLVFSLHIPPDWKLRADRTSISQSRGRLYLWWVFHKRLVKWMELWPKNPQPFNDSEITIRSLGTICYELLLNCHQSLWCWDDFQYIWLVCPYIPTGGNEMNIPKLRWTLCNSSLHTYLVVSPAGY